MDKFIIGMVVAGLFALIAALAMVAPDDAPMTDVNTPHVTITDKGGISIPLGGPMGINPSTGRSTLQTSPFTSIEL